MQTCEIKWIDANGNQTPDANPATCRVRIPAYVSQIGGRGVKHETTQWYACCAEHAKRLSNHGMHIWECEPLAAN